ncbi:unnamed protein product [Paramecium pentaurelia]|uniref:Uncharacterized protein n=1 Tax=Paramecium pentaurelia TaxID=43138 RepID=A0A8S1SQC9_9CILI|nr:unnamed protein product [Paramecium pentaurelia]
MIQFFITDSIEVLYYHCLYIFAWYPEAQQEIREEILSACTEEQILVDKVKQLKNNLYLLMKLKDQEIQLYLDTLSQRSQSIKNQNLIIKHFLQSVSEQHFINLEDFYLKRWLTPKQILDNIFQDKIESYFTLPSFLDRSKELQRMTLMKTKFIIQPNEFVVPKWTLRFLYQLEPSNCVRLIKIQDNHN